MWVYMTGQRLYVCVYVSDKDAAQVQGAVSLTVTTQTWHSEYFKNPRVHFWAVNDLKGNLFLLDTLGFK